MPRTKKIAIAKPTLAPASVAEGQIGRMTRDVLELHGQTLKEALLRNTEEYDLNSDQATNVCRLIDAITIKSKDTALRQVVSLFKS